MSIKLKNVAVVTKEGVSFSTIGHTIEGLLVTDIDYYSLELENGVIQTDIIISNYTEEFGQRILRRIIDCPVEITYLQDVRTLPVPTTKEKE